MHLSQWLLGRSPQAYPFFLPRQQIGGPVTRPIAGGWPARGLRTRDDSTNKNPGKPMLTSSDDTKALMTALTRVTGFAQKLCAQKTTSPPDASGGDAAQSNFSMQRPGCILHGRFLRIRRFPRRSSRVQAAGQCRRPGMSLPPSIACSDGRDINVQAIRQKRCPRICIAPWRTRQAHRARSFSSPSQSGRA